MRRDVFQAIADPTRREILHLISLKPLNINSVSGNFDVSRAAIYKHVKILRESGLVVVKQHGRERYCEAHLEKLNVVSSWIEQYRKFWNAKLDSLEAYLEKIQKEIEEKKKEGMNDTYAAVQVMGKLRDTLTVAKGLPKEEVEALALASEKVQRALNGAEVRKVIVVPDRLVNLVA